MREWLRVLRKEKDMKQQQVADSANISRQGYSFIESGERTPSVPTAKKIAEVLGFDWTEFFREEI